MSQPLELQLSTVVKGVTWRLYTIDFNSCDGQFSAYFYAVSDEHAQATFDDIKDTGKVGWALCSVRPGPA